MQHKPQRLSDTREHMPKNCAQPNMYTQIYVFCLSGKRIAIQHRNSEQQCLRHADLPSLQTNSHCAELLSRQPLRIIYSCCITETSDRMGPAKWSWSTSQSPSTASLKLPIYESHAQPHPNLAMSSRLPWPHADWSINESDCDLELEHDRNSWRWLKRSMAAKLDTDSKPSTCFPPDGLVERSHWWKTCIKNRSAWNLKPRIYA